MSGKLVRSAVAIVVSGVLLLLGASALRARQDEPKVQAIPKDALPPVDLRRDGPRVEAIPKVVPRPEDLKKAVADREAEWRKSEAAVTKMLDAVDLTPHALPPIPDDPPPHEGAMINYPIVIRPPDLVLVEVLEALPGRPISGERLVRPDGKISLGFYGDIHVAGLTVEQARVKIIKHMRGYLTDEVLGLTERVFAEDAGPPAAPEPPPAAKPQPREEPKKAAPKAARAGGRSVRRLSRPSASVPVRRTAQDEKKSEDSRKTVNVPIEAGGQVTITVEVRAAGKEAEEADLPEAEQGPPGPPVPLEKNGAVFVDVTAYNSMHYHVLGDVASPGELPFTANETVLNALNHAGGLLTTAEPKDIRLVRPARGGKPARVYKVDLDAIRDRGDVTSNFQIFPGDRLVVGRLDVVKKTVEIDRLAGALQTVINSILQESLTLRSLQTTSKEQHEKILKDLVEFWIQEMKRPGAKLDEETLRDALLKRLQVKP